MGAAKIRLAVASAAFLGWLGWLGYLVFQSRDPVILSRPQFLVANLHVIAGLTGAAEKPDAKIKVVEVVWSADGADAKLAAAEIPVANVEAADGWKGPGDYALALIKTKEGYRLATIPPSPGYRGDTGRIYRMSPGVRDQLAEMPRSR